MDEAQEDHDESTEQTPLVAGSAAKQRRPPHRHMLSVASIASIASVNVPKAHNGNTIVNILCAIAFVVSAAAGFVIIPLTQLVENVVCHKYYGMGNEPIDEELCKIESIQADVAFVFAIVGVCEAVVGFLAAFPWRIAADRLGRRPVFALSLLGISLGIIWDITVLWFPSVFPPSLIALSCLFLLVGGGNAVLIGIVYSMVSDVISEDKRATAFMRAHVISVIGSLVSPALSSAMLTVTSPWAAMWVGVACLLIGAVAFLFVPETLQHKTQSDAADDQSQSPASLSGHLSETYERLKESLSILKSPSLILLLLTCIVTQPFSSAVTQFLVQFVSKRYNVPISATGYIQSTYGLAQGVQALVILPLLSQFMMRDSTPKPFLMANEQERDLTLAKWSFGFVFLGFFALGAAPTVWMFILGLLVLALGSGYNSLAKSLMCLYVDPEHRSRLFSMVGMAEVIGSVYGPPMLAGLFALGMNLGGGWMGLPYFGIAVLSVFAMVMLLFVSVPKHREPGPPPYEEGPLHEN
ncbi:hypothetical protein JX266_009278 [Neoarthrinium moseri]|nr:hypothetical protein JX266_009278 [Neoarthrinium moseri]